MMMLIILLLLLLLLLLLFMLTRLLLHQHYLSCFFSSRNTCNLIETQFSGTRKRSVDVLRLKQKGLSDLYSPLYTAGFECF